MNGQPISKTKLSVIVALSQSGHDLESFLETLIRQTTDEKIEIIIAGYCRDELWQSMTVKYPDLDFMRFPEKTALPVLLEAGIARSTGQIIALTDTGCEVDGRWVTSILEAHEASTPVIGGSVECDARTRLTDWAVYFCEYGQFMQPIEDGAANELPGNNLSFKRWTLSEGQEFLQGGFWKTYWCRRLQEKGISLELKRSIVVYYKKSFDFIPLLIRRFHHGRCFAGMRVKQSRLLMRVAYSVGSVLLPPLFLARTIIAVVPKRRHLKEFVFSLPITVLVIASWSLGEFCGYVTGTGKSCAHIY